MQRVLEVSAALSLAGGIAAIFIAARRSNRPTASSDSTPRVSRRTPRNDFLGLGQDAWGSSGQDAPTMARTKQNEEKRWERTRSNECP
jgi:hypothetical protein